MEGLLLLLLLLLLLVLVLLLQMDYGSGGYYSDPKGRSSYLNVCRANDFPTPARCCLRYNYVASRSSPPSSFHCVYIYIYIYIFISIEYFDN